MTDYQQQQIPESNSLCKGLRVPRILFSAKVNSIEVNFLKMSDVRLLRACHTLANFMKELKGILLKKVKEPKRKGELRACFKNIDK